MRKKATLFLGLLAGLTAHGQGLVNFDTQIIGTTALVYFNCRVSQDINSEVVAVRLSGTSYMAQLWAAPGAGRPSNELVPVGKPVFLRSGVNAGYVQNSGIGPDGLPVIASVYVFNAGQPGSSPGGAATIQMRAWATSFGTFDRARSGGGYANQSSLLTLNTTGYPPNPPPNLVGLTLGNPYLSTPVCPEPSTLAFGLLAGAALLWRRRK